MPGFEAELKQGSTVVIDDRIERAAPSEGAFVDASADLASAITAPLLRDGRLRALFMAEAEGPCDWPPDDVTLLEEVATRAWDAVERAQAAEILRRNQARQSFLLVLGDRLRELDDPADIMETVAESIGRHLDADRAGYGEIASDDDLVFDTGWSAGSMARLSAASRSPLWATRRRPAPRALDELRAMRAGAADDGAGHRCRISAPLVAVPLIRDGRLRGALTLGRLRSHRWSAEEIALAGEAAARLWEALERTRAEAALRGLNATLEDRVVQRTLELTSSDTRFRTLFETAPAPIFLVRVGAGRACASTKPSTPRRSASWALGPPPIVGTAGRPNDIERRPAPRALPRLRAHRAPRPVRGQRRGRHGAAHRRRRAGAARPSSNNDTNC